LAFGTAAAASVLAPVASMAATAPLPTYNDSTKTLGSAVDKKPALIPATILTAMPATPMPTVVTGTINGDVNQQAIVAANGSASVKASYTTLVSKYNAWKIARTPVVTAYLAYKTAPAAQKAAKLKIYQTKLAAFNKAGGAAKYAAYKTAFTTYNAKFTPAFATAKNAVKANHFMLTAGTYGGDASTPGNLCSAPADNMTALELHSLGATSIGINDGDPNDNNNIIRCSGGRIEYFLKDGSSSGGTAIWEYLNASATVSGGRVTGITTVTDATNSSLITYTPYITDYTSGKSSATPWTFSQIPASQKPDFNTYALNLLNKSGAFDATFAGKATVGKTCISAATTATLSCLSYQKSLTEALHAAVKGMPY
jgi:hypothetical protein